MQAYRGRKSMSIGLKSVRRPFSQKRAASEVQSRGRGRRVHGECPRGEFQYCLQHSALTEQPLRLGSIELPGNGSLVGAPILKKLLGSLQGQELGELQEARQLGLNTGTAFCREKHYQSPHISLKLDPPKVREVLPQQLRLQGLCNVDRDLGDHGGVQVLG
jgi:hypothetical protein